MLRIIIVSPDETQEEMFEFFLEAYVAKNVAKLEFCSDLAGLYAFVHTEMVNKRRIDGIMVSIKDLLFVPLWGTVENQLDQDPVTAGIPRGSYLGEQHTDPTTLIRDDRLRLQGPQPKLDFLIRQLGPPKAAN